MVIHKSEKHMDRFQLSLLTAGRCVDRRCWNLLNSTALKPKSCSCLQGGGEGR